MSEPAQRYQRHAGSNQLPHFMGVQRMAETDSILWKPVAGFPGYEVSNDGQVRSWLPQRNFAPKPSAPRLLKLPVDRDGYHRLGLRRDGKQIFKRVSVLVATAFIGSPPFSSAVVRHKDGTRTNDTHGNLQWGSVQDNHDDCAAHGTRLKGTSINTAKLNEADVRNILLSNDTDVSLARLYGTSPGAIWHIRHGRTWKHVSRKDTAYFRGESV